jgi:hypothetical protein
VNPVHLGRRSDDASGDRFVEDAATLSAIDDAWIAEALRRKAELRVGVKPDLAGVAFRKIREFLTP